LRPSKGWSTSLDPEVEIGQPDGGARSPHAVNSFARQVCDERVVGDHAPDVVVAMQPA
jgi:hypothetical protein